jgi:hypothetical protein
VASVVCAIAAALEAQLAEANDMTAQQASQLAAVGTETMNMRQAMAVMKEQAGAMAVRAQAAAEEAAAKRAAAEAELADTRASLEDERARLTNLQACRLRWMLTYTVRWLSLATSTWRWRAFKTQRS